MIIKVQSLDQPTTKWICEHIGPIRYYLHHRMGGDTWQYNRITKELTVNESKYLTMLLLKIPMDVQV